MDLDEPEGRLEAPTRSFFPMSSADRYEPADIGSWNREVQDAVNRRLNLDRPRSPPSTRHFRDSLPYRRLGSRVVSEDVDPPRAHRQSTELDLWGEIPIDVAGASRQDPMHLFGWRAGSIVPSHGAETPTSRSFRLQRSFGEPETPSTMNMMGDNRPGLGDIPPPRSLFDHDWLNRHHHEYNPSSLYNAYVSALGPPGHSSASHYNLFSSVQLKPEMSEEDRTRVVQMVARAVTRWPSDCRRKMAENMLEYVAWGSFGEREDMERDGYCSVCHDEVGSPWLNGMLTGSRSTRMRRR